MAFLGKKVGYFIKKNPKKNPELTELENAVSRTFLFSDIRPKYFQISRNRP